MDGIELRGDVAGVVLPDVGAVAALGEGLRNIRVGHGTGQRGLRFGAEVGRDGHDAGDVGGALGIDVAGVFVGGLGGGGALLGEGRSAEKEERSGKSFHGDSPRDEN